MMRNFAAAAIAAMFLAACGGETTSSQTETTASAPAEEARDAANAGEAASLDTIAGEFVKLSLGIGFHDADFVDAYHGPEEWAQTAQEEQRSLDQLEADAQGLLISIQRANGDDPDVRGAMLEKLTTAALARIKIVKGEAYPFDEETKLIYDAVAPQYDLAEFDAALAEIDALLPGDAPLNERVDNFRLGLAVPEDKLKTVFDAAIDECRARTMAHYTLPENERFTLEFVTDKAWGGYNWYQGDFESLIQVNTDFPIIIDRAVDLGCHEGYPGHHVWNMMLERDLLNENGWIEYSVYPLFSPLSITAEGSANYGIELAFPGNEKIAFERDVLFPLAGLDPEKAKTLEQLNNLTRKLSHSRNHIAREYLDGRITRDEAIDMQMKYGLVTREKADQSVRFIEKYRGYVLNYNLGRDLVEAYVERKAAGGMDRWEAFEILLKTPLAASDIAAAK